MTGEDRGLVVLLVVMASSLLSLLAAVAWLLRHGYGVPLLPEPGRPIAPWWLRR